MKLARIGALVALAAFGCGAPALATQDVRERVVCDGHARRVGVGDDYGCAICEDRSVECWGSTARGQAGNGELGLVDEAGRVHGWRVAPPSRVVGLTDAIELSVGQSHACALSSSREVFCWGEGHFGQLGDGAMRSSGVAVRARGIEGASHVSVGPGHSCAVGLDARAWCWGWNVHGNLGDGTMEEQSEPRSVVGLLDATRVAAGGRFTCALRRSGQIVCWGTNDMGELGDPALSRDIEAPSGRVPGGPVQGIEGAVDVSAGGSRACAIDRGGRGRCWGAVEHGRLGAVREDASGVAVLAGVQPLAQIVAGEIFTFGRTREGAIYRWGGAGLEAMDLRSLPEEQRGPWLVAAPPAIDLAVSHHDVCAVLEGGELRCWSTFAPSSRESAAAPLGRAPATFCPG